MSSVKRIILALTGNSAHCREIARGVYLYCAQHPSWEIFYEGAISSVVLEHIRGCLKDGGVDGLIGQIQQIQGDAMTEIIRESGVPVVSVSDCHYTDHPSVRSDARNVAALAAKYFCDKGLRNLAYAGSDHPFSKSVTQCFCDMKGRVGFHFETIVLDELTSRLRDQEQLGNWLQALPKPVGILTMPDYHGKNLCSMCRRLHLAVPDQVAVLGVGNDDLDCLMSIPPLSSVITAAKRIGYEAAAIMDGMLSKSAAPPPKPILIAPVGIAERQSTSVMQIADPQVAAALKFIHQHAGQRITVDDMLKVVSMSRSALDQRFLKLLGRTPKAEIIRARLAQTKVMSGNPNVKLSFIASKSGFRAYSQFNALFQRETGMSPAKYRDRHFPS